MNFSIVLDDSHHEKISLAPDGQAEFLYGCLRIFMKNGCVELNGVYVGAFYRDFLYSVRECLNIHKKITWTIPDFDLEISFESERTSLLVSIRDGKKVLAYEEIFVSDLSNLLDNFKNDILIAIGKSNGDPIKYIELLSKFN